MEVKIEIRWLLYEIVAWQAKFAVGLRLKQSQGDSLLCLVTRAPYAVSPLLALVHCTLSYLSSAICLNGSYNQITSLNHQYNKINTV
jgi:hypothetical protein